MSSVIISGDVSGTVTLQAPSAAGSTTLTLPATNGTLVLNNSSDQTINGLTVGKGAGSVATNTAVGVSALAANTSGTSNTSVGSGALSLNTSGNYNTAVGVNSLPANTTGNSNSGFGIASLNGNTTGSSNTAVGFSALNSNTTASNNTAVGYQAGYSKTTGDGTTIVGYQAGYSNTTAYNNVLLGYQAGYALTTGADNVAIGRGAAFNGAGDNNSIVIGAGATGKGINTGFISPNGGGVYQGNNSAAWSITSDQRIKENIVDVSNGLSVITALRPVHFDYIENKKSDTGFIAQEYQQVLPTQVIKHAANEFEKELVGEDEIYGINPNLVPYLVKAIQELNAKVDAQAAEIAALKGAA